VLLNVGEALAAAAVVVLTVWLVIKAVWWAIREAALCWRTSVLVLVAWWRYWGVASLVLITGAVVVVLTGWWLSDTAVLPFRTPLTSPSGSSREGAA
jgi:hypothetical protein